MLIHNKIVVTKGDKTYVAYNSLLEPALESIINFKAYSKFMAIGLGADETNIGDQYLHDYLLTLPLVTENANFDPRNGQLFLTKKMVLDEMDNRALEIVEIGLTDDGENPNPKIANRFILNGGEPIYRDPMEEMTFEITLFLEQDQNSSVALTGGSNPLVKLFLGDGTIGGVDPVFKVAKGENDAKNEVVLERVLAGEDVFDATLTKVYDENNKSATLKVFSDIGPGLVTELLVVMDGVVVARQNVSQFCAVEEGLQSVLVADADNMLTLDVFGLNGVQSIAHVTSSTLIEDYTLSSFGTGFKGGLIELFGGYGFSKTSEIFVSKTSARVAIRDGLVFKVFDFSSGECVELDASAVDVSQAYMIRLFEDYILLKNDLGSSKYSVTAYCFQNGAYKKVQFYPTTASYPAADKASYWLDMDLVYVDTTSGKRMTLFVAPDDQLVLGYRMYSDSNKNLFSETTLVTNNFKPLYIRTMNPSNRLGYCYVTYDQLNSRMGYSMNKNYYSSTNVDAVEISSNYVAQGYPKFAKNYVFAADEAAGTIRGFNVEMKSAKTVQFSNVVKIWPDDKLEYVAVKTTSGIDVFYLDGNLVKYEFGGGLNFNKDNVEKIFFVGDYLVVVGSDDKFYGIKIHKNKTIINGAPRGNGFYVTYSVDKTPGLSGGNVKVNVNMTTSV